MKRNSITVLAAVIMLSTSGCTSATAQNTAVVSPSDSAPIYDWDTIQADAIAKADSGWWKESMENHEQRIAWWREARFGCFVHWGAPAELAGIWQGREWRGYAEHIQRWFRIDQDTYLNDAIRKFNPQEFDAEEWIRLVKEAGMKYFVITAKHHDGFAMYDSDVSDYNIVEQTPFHRDPMQELKEACKKYDIKFGFYYSQAFDWGEKYGVGNDWEFNRPGGDKKLYSGKKWYIERPDLYREIQEKYTNAKAIPQIKELIKKYDPDILWFDTSHKLPFWENLRMLEEIRKLSNTIVVNGRLARVDGRSFGDYINTGDRAVEFSSRDGDWEGIPTTNESYGYSAVDTRYKPASFFIRLIAKAASRNGNTLLNIGPMGNGKINPVDVNILRRIGSWMSKYGDSLYNTRNSELPIPHWGVATQRENKLYLHVFEWPQDGRLAVGGLKTLPAKAYTLADPRTDINFDKEDESCLTLQVGKNAPDGVNSVVVLEFNKPIITDEARLLETSKINRLLFFDAKKEGAKADELGYGDGKPRCFYIKDWNDKEQWVSWKIRVNAPVEYNMTLHYYRDLRSGSLRMELDGHPHIQGIDPPVHRYDRTRPNATKYLGKLKLTPGVHTITIRPESQPTGELLKPLEIVLIPES